MTAFQIPDPTARAVFNFTIQQYMYLRRLDCVVCTQTPQQTWNQCFQAAKELYRVTTFPS